MKIIALIVAGGRGARASLATRGIPKQYAQLGGISVLARTLAQFESDARISAIQSAIHADDDELYAAASAGYAKCVSPPALGGAARQESVLNGLESIAPFAPDLVLIHDAARPFVSTATTSGVIEALASHQGAIPGLPVTDTLKRAGLQRTVAGTVSRDGLWRVQTPQGFHFPAILDAHRRAAAAGHTDLTDDAAVAEWAGLDTVLVDGDARNIKLTTPEDFLNAEREFVMAQRTETRIGSGFDVHRFAEGSSVWLGGIEIAHTHRLEGHSDADVVLHALTDALLGAIGDGDIGQHFPPGNPKWKGAASRIFLEDAVRRVRERGGRVINVDITVLAEAPRIGPHREAMKAVIGAVLGLAPDRVGIKATTTEQMGFTGRREGIAAMASASVELLEACP